MRVLPVISLHLLCVLVQMSAANSGLPSTTAAVPTTGGVMAQGGNGYVMSFTGMHQWASTRKMSLDAQNEQVQKLDSKFTIMLWARFHFRSSVNVHFMIGHKDQGNFMQPFGGWEFGGSAPETVSKTGDHGKGWHHYAVSWDQASGKRVHYVDGVNVSTSNVGKGESWIERDAYIAFGNCYPTQFLKKESYSDCNPEHRFNGELDDVAVFNTVMTLDQVQEHMSTPIKDTVNETNLVIFWDFESVPMAEADTFRYVRNRGMAGRDYDLRLGGMPKESVFSRKYTVAGSKTHEIIAPRIVPSQEWRSKPLSKTAPIVVVAAPGEDVSQQVNAIAGGTHFTYKTPDEFNKTHTDSTTYWNIEVHVLPQEKPTVPRHALTATGSEDQTMVLQIYSFPLSGSATYRITQLPAKGTLYDLGSDRSTTRHKNVTKDSALSTREALFVMYKPYENQFGTPFDSFEYTASDGLAISKAATVSISIVASNDLPDATPTKESMMEDVAGILIPVSGSDAEEESPLELMVMTLPSKGKLYHTTDGTLSGRGILINKKYNPFEVASEGEGTISQFLDAVTKVSSFWGNPPSVAYHPVAMIGPPDCNKYGECSTAGDWVNNNSRYPLVGQRVLHVQDQAQTEGLLAYVMGYNEATKTVDIEYHTMYKTVDGKLSPCVMPDPTKLNFPDDCKPYASWDNNVKNPVTNRVKRTVDRTKVSPQQGGVWCPLNKGFVGNKTMKGGGAFGPNYAFLHNQADIYTPATEYVEATVNQTVYPVLVEVGSPRGMGHVVGIKVKNLASDKWVSLYSGKALVDESASFAETRTYWSWAPQSCRTHFKTNQFRIEVDTSEETGISDWNYIDYIKVYGADSLQPAALPHGTKNIVYIPDRDQNGVDTFEYRSSDCPGDLFRFSPAARVDLTIQAVNDAPTVVNSYISMFTDEHQDIQLHFNDTDNELEDLTLKFVEVRGTQIQVAAKGTNGPLGNGGELPKKPPQLSVRSGDSDGVATVAFSVTDTEGLVAIGELVITIKLRPSNNEDILIAVIAVLGSVIGIALLVGSYQACRYLKAAMRGKRAHEASCRERVRRAVKSAFTTHSSCYLITFETLKQMGGLKPHEVARDNQWFKIVDTHEELVELVNTNPVVFISHQWVAWEHPDPDNIQYNEMVEACQEICKRQGFHTEQLYIFLDYLSIPQKNFNLRLAAINSLGVFSSIAPFFVVVAPDTIHKDTGASMNKASYQRRGWCRLEQWGHMCLQGMENMFWYDGKAGILKDLDEAEEVAEEVEEEAEEETEDEAEDEVEDEAEDKAEDDEAEDKAEEEAEEEAKDNVSSSVAKCQDWYLESTLVFEGDYTNPDNKEELVDVVLGLYSMVVRRKDGVTKELHDLIQKNYKRVFPEEYFSDLPQLLERMMASDKSLRSMTGINSVATILSLNYCGQRSTESMTADESEISWATPTPPLTSNKTKLRGPRINLAKIMEKRLDHKHLDHL